MLTVVGVIVILLNEGVQGVLIQSVTASSILLLEGVPPLKSRLGSNFLRQDQC